MAQCNDCKINFVNVCNLRTHVKRKHPDKLDILCPRKRNLNGSGTFKCKECGNSFTRLDNLRYHIKKQHSNKSEELLASLNTKEYTCDECGEQFHLLSHLHKHKGSHKVYNIQIRCPLCDYVGASRDILITHYTNSHNLKIENETYEFETLEDFQLWKSKMEERTFSNFLKKRTKRINQTAVKIEYDCHRSGYFKARGANIRHVKTQGTNKINGYCPANLKVISKNGKYFVNYCETHVGHKQEEDLGHLFLTKAEHDQIAAKIASKVPLQVILNEVKDSISNCQLQRIHLLTKKDLYNIEKSYNLNSSSVRHENDASSVDAWVNKLQSKLSDLRHRHKLSETMDIEKVIYDNLTWMVASSSTNELYAVKEVKLDCTCKLTCLECNACIHRFSCTCLDNSIKWNMCKHIHLVCRYIKQLPMDVTDADEESFIESKLVKDISKKKQEVSSLIETLSTNRPKHQRCIDQVKERKQKLLNDVLEQLELVSSIEEIEVFERNIATIRPSLAAVRNHNKSLVGFSEGSASIKKNTK